MVYLTTEASKAARDHVVITGTGRCGTTFLVELLTRLGLDTGFKAEELSSKKFKHARAGLEHDIRVEGCPFIVKCPGFCNFADEVMRRTDIVIEHIFIPMRDLEAAAESRRLVHRDSYQNLSFTARILYRLRPWVLPGGLWRTTSNQPGAQEEILLTHIYKLMLAVSNTSLPVTFLRYPRIIKDSSYLFEKLRPILRNVPFQAFETAFQETARPELVHTFTESDR